MLRVREGGEQIIDSVDVTCGLSLGEYTALAFAGAFRLVYHTTLNPVKKDTEIRTVFVVKGEQIFQVTTSSIRLLVNKSVENRLIIYFGFLAKSISLIERWWYHKSHTFRYYRKQTFYFVPFVPMCTITLLLFLPFSVTVFILKL